MEENRTNEYNTSACSTSVKRKISELEIEDRGGFLWWLVGFLCPVGGVLLYLVMRNTMSRNAKATVKGVITGVVVIAALILVYILIIALLISGGAYV